MTIQINNQQPAEIYKTNNILPRIDISLPGDEYLEKQTEFLKESFVDPLFIPLNQGNDVQMNDVSDPSNPQPFDADAVTNGIQHLWLGDSVDANLDQQLTDIYYQSLLHSHPNNWRIEEQLGLENLAKQKLPLPSRGENGQVVSYTPQTDLIPTAKQLLATPSDNDIADLWFASLTGFLHYRMKNMLLITVQSNQEWDLIKNNISQLRQTLNQQGTIKRETNTLLSDFDKISLGGELSAGIFLPQINHNEPHSFTRILMNLLSIYEDNNPEKLHVQPLNMKQVIYPDNIIVLNLEEYAHATDKEIINDWKNLENAFTIQKRLNMVSIKNLMTSKQVNAVTAPQKGYKRGNTEAVRRTQRPFANKPITSKQMLHLMKKVINRATTKKQTENNYKTQKTTYLRPNRRNPNDINLAGKLTTTKYRPDIHIYLDTSGSISEEQYRDAVGSLIMLTKEIDANLYLSSFSHKISQTSLVRTRDRSLKEVYKNFLTIPKVGGGTEFENVWNKIDQLDKLNKKAGKSYQLNFVITDFGYGLRRDRKFHREQPSHKNTFYVPISSDPRHWKAIIQMAKNFSKEMASAGAHGIRNHMLM